MTGFIITIIIIVVVFNRIKKEQFQNLRPKNFEEQQTNPQEDNSTYVSSYSAPKQAPKQATRQTSNAKTNMTTQSRRMTDEDRRRLEEYRSRKNLQATSQRAASDNEILKRAQMNTAKYAKDETLDEMEKEHQHSEKEKAALSMEQREQIKTEHPHDAAHVTAMVDLETESILGNIEDLMIKGYSSDLSFERDFLGEAMDMINQFTYSSVTQPER